MSGRVLLIAGVPGVGDTLIRRVAGRLQGKTLGGFCTEEVREDGQRTGFLEKATPE